MSSAIGISIVGGMSSMGIVIDKFDEMTNTLYVQIPERSCDYDINGNIKDGDDLAKTIKKKFIDTGYFGEGTKLKYKLYNIDWTEELKNEAIKKFKGSMRRNSYDNI